MSAQKNRRLVRSIAEELLPSLRGDLLDGIWGNDSDQFVWNNVKAKVKTLRPETLGRIVSTGKDEGSTGVSLYEVHHGPFVNERDSGLDMLIAIATTVIVAKLCEMIEDPEVEQRGASNGHMTLRVIKITESDFTASGVQKPEITEQTVWEGNDVRELSRQFPPSNIMGADELGRHEIEDGWIRFDHRFERLQGGRWVKIGDPRVHLDPALTETEAAIDAENRRLFPGDFLRPEDEYGPDDHMPDFDNDDGEFGAT